MVFSEAYDTQSGFDLLSKIIDICRMDGGLNLLECLILLFDDLTYGVGIGVKSSGQLG